MAKNIGMKIKINCKLLKPFSLPFFLFSIYRRTEKEKGDKLFRKCINEQKFFSGLSKGNPPDFRDKNQADSVFAFFKDFFVLSKKEITITTTHCVSLRMTPLRNTAIFFGDRRFSQFSHSRITAYPP